MARRRAPTETERAQRRGPPPPKSQEVGEETLTDLERKILEAFSDEIGAPSGLVAKDLGISVAQVTKVAKALAARGLVEDTGYAMKFTKRLSWQWIDKPKTEGGMTSRPGASTVWKTTDAGRRALENINA